MLKSYKYRIYPDEKQKEMFAKHFGCVRFLYNWGLNKKIEEYKETGKSSTRFALEREIKNLRIEYPFLQEVCCDSLHRAIRYLDVAYKAFFKQYNRFPCFKSKYNHQSFQSHNGTNIYFDINRLDIPKIKNIKIKIHREFEGRIINTTISKTPSEKYYAALAIEDDIDIPEKINPSKERTIGIKLGINEDYFAMLSNGEIVENLKPLSKSMKRIKKLQRRFSKKVKGSKNKDKQRIKLATVHEKVANQRKDFLHKLSRKVVDNYEAICLKDEKIKKKLEEETKENALKIADSSFGIFKNMLIYKNDWIGKETRIVKTNEDLDAQEILDSAFEE